MKRKITKIALIKTFANSMINIELIKGFAKTGAFNHSFQTSKI